MKHYKRVKATYDRGYVNAMDKIRVFIESNQKVMYIGTGEYANASTAQASYTNAINLIRASGLLQAALYFFITHSPKRQCRILQRRNSKWCIWFTCLH